MQPALEPLSARAGERSNWDILSLLRFFLALIVATTHLGGYSPRLGPLGWIASLGAFEAILGFLLISGYSIGNSIQKEPHGFFFRRMLRIYPVYFAAVLVTWFVQRDALNGSFALTLLINLLFLGQLVVNHSYVGVGWSLGVEVWLYALAPIFLRLRARTLEILIALSFICFAVYSGCRSLFHLPYYSGTLGGINLPCLAFIWITGFYLATTTHEKNRALRIAGSLLLGHLLVTLVIQSMARFKHHDLHSFLAIDMTDFLFHGALLLLIYAIFSGILAHRFHLNVVQRRICRFLGDISYPLYLVHLPTFILLAPYTQNAALLLLGALVLSTTVYFTCDFYSLRRKLA